MENLFGILGIAVVLFASTNVDDIFVLLGFFADPKFRPPAGCHRPVSGHCRSLRRKRPGLFDLSRHSRCLYRPPRLGTDLSWPEKTGGMLREGSGADDAPEDHEKVSAGHGNIVAVAAVTIANGGDNISIYTPLFATRTIDEIAVIAIVFVLMTALWLGVAHFLVNHPTIGRPIRRYGHRAVPFVLVALGTLILYEAGTVRLFYR